MSQSAEFFAAQEEMTRRGRFYFESGASGGIDMPVTNVITPEEARLESVVAVALDGYWARQIALGTPAAHLALTSEL